ncbi:MAG: hypothetical protein J5790_07170 [Bacteroidaceae bacterium]|nr:hypothetical protein [Bacteroidaceae bacterium]
MKKLFISLFVVSTLMTLTACEGIITKAVTNYLNNISSGSKKSSDENGEEAKMQFSDCERQDDGQTPDGAYAALDVNLVLPKGEGDAQRNVARGIRAICDRSPVAEELGKAPADASIEGVADYYASAFQRGLKTGKVYPLCTYSLRISEKFQNEVGVVFSVTTGVWGNGGPWEYDTFVRFSDGNVLDSKNLVKIPSATLRALVKKYESEDLSTTISVEEGGYQVMPAADGKANLHVSMGSHFFEDVKVPVEEVAPYLTAEGKAVFDAQVSSTPIQHTQTQQSTATQTEARPFTLTDGKLGPIQTGQRFSNIPATYEGLYDKFARQVETKWDEDGEWTEEFYQFTKTGKNVFRVYSDNSKRITSITLQAGSASIVKTQEGFYVGYPARTLFTKKSMEWMNYFQGIAFATSGHYCYEVKDEDLNTEIPHKVSDIKPTAKISNITYSHEAYGY